MKKIIVISSLILSIIFIPNLANARTIESAELFNQHSNFASVMSSIQDGFSGFFNLFKRKPATPNTVPLRQDNINNALETNVPVVDDIQTVGKDKLIEIMNKRVDKEKTMIQTSKQDEKRN